MPRRLRRRHRAAAFAVFLGLTALAAVIVAAIAPPKLQARCSGTKPCGVPPTLAQPLHSEKVWRSSALGFALEYSPQNWTVGQQGPAGIELESRVVPLDLTIQGAPQATNPAALLATELGKLKSNILGLTQDPSTADQILGPEVGYHYGAGGAYTGAIDSPQGVSDQVFVTVLAATSNSLGVVVTTLSTETSTSNRRKDYSIADEVLNTVTWPGSGT
jgi:hypothetical protein